MTPQNYLGAAVALTRKIWTEREFLIAEVFHRGDAQV